MDTLKVLIKNVDEDYLIGLSNKGTVKRAAKDLEKESPALTWQDGEVEVALQEEKCRLRSPLNESSCSCPSRSMCRHIITAVLWMKQELGKEPETSCGQEPVPAFGEEREPAQGAGQSPGQGKEPVQESRHFFQEILEIPAEKLQRICGRRRYRDFLAHIRAGELPPIEESSIVTVTLPWERAVVKLLLPFSGSSCTCHSRELCVHKAQAVLAYQLEKKAVTLRQLEGLQETEASFDEVLVGQAAAAVRENICQQMRTGLSRQSPGEAESLERLAIIAHRAGLPALESSLRILASGYQQYFSRSAAFEGGELLDNILAVYRRAKDMETVIGSEGEAGSKNSEIRRLAGNFRDAYEPVGKLHLAAMGGRGFLSKSGYAGEVYYFLETEQKKWYTWTDVRPTIYEGTRKRPPANSSAAFVPWGLNCSRAELQNLTFDLQNAKAASGGRLSVSQESKGEITGTRSLADENIRQIIWWDYEKMLKDYFYGNAKQHGGQKLPDNSENEERREKLVLVGTPRWEKSVFDTVNQQFLWSVFDRRGRELLISIKYTKEEQMTIQFLERMEKRLRGYSFENIVFFGRLYLNEEGRLCLYPIEVFFGEVQEERGDFPVTAKYDGASWEVLSTMKQYLQEAERCLLDVFYCGMDSASEEILSGLLSFSEDGERLGLHRAGECLAHIAELLKGKRHQMEFSPDLVIEIMEKTKAYLRACREKLSYDMAFAAMKGEKDEFKG